jgi:hypothetical protein
VRYASWDLAHVHLVDEREAQVLCRIYPLDKTKHAEGVRRRLEAPEGEDSSPPQTGIAPLLGQLMEQYRASGLPPAYLPKPLRDHEEEEQ